MVTGLISKVGDGYGLALLIGVAVGTTDNDDIDGLVLLINSLLQCTLLLAGDAIIGLESVEIKGINMFPVNGLYVNSLLYVLHVFGRNKNNVLLVGVCAIGLLYVIGFE